MAFSITSNFAGDAGTKLIASSLNMAPTISGDHITIIPNVKLKTRVNRMYTGDNLLQADSCSFNAAGTVTLDERELVPGELKVNVEVCKTDLEAHWESMKIRAGALESDITFYDVMLDYFSKRIAFNVDKLIWQGDTAGATGTYLDEADGIVTLALADGTVVDVSTPTTLTSSNIIAELKRGYELIPDSIVNDPNLRIYVPMNAYKFYQSALSSSSASIAAYAVEGTKSLNFIGIPVVPVNMEANHYVITTKDNLYFGTDLVSDFANFKVIDMSETDGSDNVRVKARLKAGAQYAYGADIVLYGA